MARILLVDDSRFITSSLKMIVEKDGHEVVGIGCDGNEGLALFKSHKPDLVLLDITMPNRDGQDCLQDIINEKPDAKVIMISAIKEQDIVENCRNIGAKDFIAKPLQLGNDEFMASFHDKIRKALL